MWGGVLSVVLVMYLNIIFNGNKYLSYVNKSLHFAQDRKRKEGNFYLTTHSTHFIYGYMAFFYMHHPTDRITHTTAFFYTSRGALAGTRNS